MNIAYILLAYGSLFLLGIIDNSRGPIYPELLVTFNITKTQGSLLFSFASLSGFFISIFSQAWLKYLGVLNSSRLALLLDALACMIMGSVDLSASGYYQFLIGALVLGLAMGIKGITLNLLIIQADTGQYRRRIFAGMHSMYGIASLLAPIIIGQLFRFDLSWKSYFLYLAAISSFGLLLSFKTKRKSENVTQKRPSNLPTKKVIRYGFIFSLYVASEILISSRLVVYLTEVGHFSKESAAYYLSGFFMCLLAGRLFFSLRHIEVSSLRLLNISLIGSIIITITGILIYPPLLMLNGLSMSFFFPAGMDYIASVEGDSADYIMAKVMMSVSAGLVIMHLGFGLLSDFLGLSLSIWIVISMLGLSWYLLQNLHTVKVKASS